MMTAAVIGATGRVGSEIVRGLLARGDPVAALVRDPDKARHAFGEPVGGLTRDQPASPLQHRPVRLVERGAVLDDPPRHLLGVAARRGARGARTTI
jgi:nucleoside-diphosphate-sugar epimerase